MFFTKAFGCFLIGKLNVLTTNKCEPEGCEVWPLKFSHHLFLLRCQKSPQFSTHFLVRGTFCGGHWIADIHRKTNSYRLLVLNAKLDTCLFWSSHSGRNPLALALSGSFLVLKFHPFAFVLPRSCSPDFSLSYFRVPLFFALRPSRSCVYIHICTVYPCIVLPVQFWMWWLPTYTVYSI